MDGGCEFDMDLDLESELELAFWDRRGGGWVEELKGSGIITGGFVGMGMRIYGPRYSMLGAL